MEVKIGISDSTRELVIASAQTPAEVEKLVSAALADGTSTLSLADEKGRKYVVVTSKISYVEIGAAAPRSVGFTS